jgi:uroporphyrinogen-III decarboxylase
LRVSDLIGIENLGLPFCMTVEAEALGAEVEMDSIYNEPRVVKYPLSRLKESKRNMAVLKR